MIGRKSRYANAKVFSAYGGLVLFPGIRPRDIDPAPGVLEYTIKEGDRLDLLSLHFYSNTQRWWRILDANPELVFGADLSLAQYVGETLLIPRLAEPGSGR